MGSAFVYDAFTDDYSTIGICGALTPTSITFHEIAGGISEVKMEHPLDNAHKYECLQEGRKLKVDAPVRSVPEIQNGQFVTVVEKWTVRNTAINDNRYIYNGKDTSKHKKKLHLVPVGAEVVVVAKYEDDSQRWKVKYTYSVTKKKKTTSKTITGFMAHDSNTLELTETRMIPDRTDGIEDVAPSWSVEEQMFTIWSVVKSDDGVSVTARHGTYDLLKNLTDYSENGTASLQDAGDGILGECVFDHDFTFHTNIAGEKSGFHFEDKDPITAFLDPDIGIVSRWGGQLIRDNYSFTVLDNAGVNRGLIFSYGKNTKSIRINIDISDVATAIRPKGQNEDGTTLHLEHSYICDADYNLTQLDDTKGIVYGIFHYVDDAGNVRCSYPSPGIAPLDCDDCKIDKKGGVTAAIVKNRMLDQAVKALKSGAETAKASVDIDMQQLGYTEQWAVYRTLEKSFIYDTAQVYHPKFKLAVETTITEIEWDCILDRPISLHFGSLRNLVRSIPGWQITSMSGSKLMPGTVGAGQLSEGSISAKHLQAESVTADAIAANSITARMIAAGEITAEKIAANAITAAKIAAAAVTAQAIAAGAITAGKIAAGAITTGLLAAEAVTADKMKAGTITADSGIIAVGAIGTAQIADGSITEAKIVSLNADVIKSGTLATERLILIGKDGLIYEINASSSGLSLQELTDEKYQHYLNGTVIVARSITAAQIAAETITSNEIHAGAITAGKIDVADLFASQAFITALTTSQIFADGGTLNVVVGNLGTVSQQVEQAMEDVATAQNAVEDAASDAELANERANEAKAAASSAQDDVDTVKSTLQKWFTFDNIRGLIIQKPSYTDEHGQLHPASVWSTVTDEVGYHIYSTQQSDPVGSFQRGGLKTTGILIGDILCKKTSNGDWVWTDPM